MGSFRCFAFVVLTGALLVTAGGISRAQNPDRTAAAKYGWGFRNFADKEFSWDLFSHSFFGVPLDPNITWLTATFDRAYYEAAYRFKLPQANGNCFGLSLMSIMMNRFGGYYGYCAPPIAWKGDTSGYWSGGATGPADTALHRVINIMHGRQLSLAAVETYLDQAMGGHSLNCNYGVTLAEQTIGKEGPFVVAITEGVSPFGGGHALVAYGVTRDNNTHTARIWVVDSNRLWAVPTNVDSGWYAGDSNHIDCNLSSGTWSFMMAGGDLWPHGGAGHLIVVPSSLVGTPGRTPSSLGLAMGELLSKLFLFDGTAFCWNIVTP